MSRPGQRHRTLLVSLAKPINHSAVMLMLDRSRLKIPEQCLCADLISPILTPDFHRHRFRHLSLHTLRSNIHGSTVISDRVTTPPNIDAIIS